ncbi:terminase small subunit [Rhodococcus aetherivorans]|uniref:terminase small subunit n=1 Tax=Rhodococcus aetherivorans TaxID=191292 RepID=UPI0003E29589|nr:terminase small subunit [Rhodococcus aetherivorans]ETT25248.1 hypothetical protein RR21198_3988 [Rhodococcus rhodochrous ATCC 21198]MDV6295198.1 terminase small subunit [Rhodococcus aetherivorans]NGP28480.1 hypothetical protein [Rhodococcus aetherivorans]
MADIAEQEEKNKGGRPLKFATVADLKAQIETYFNSCDPHTEMRRVEDGVKQDGSTNWVTREVMTEQRPYTVLGLARALRTTRDTLIDYESGKYDDRDDTDQSGDKFSDAIKDAKARINEQVEERMLSGEAPATPSIFWLKNNAQWKDRQEIDHTTAGESINAYSGLTTEELRKLASGK